MLNFIPSLHFDSPEFKLTPEWGMKVIHYYYRNSAHKNLLHGKDVEEIEAYSVGKFDMRPYKRMFKSIQRAMRQTQNDNDVNRESIIQNADKTGLDWHCLPLIPTKLNSAVSIVQKIPVEVTCTASDLLAAKKKQEDIQFLLNKRDVEDSLQEISDKMGLGKVDLGSTKYSATKFSDSPYGLDLSKPEQLDVFANILYTLAVEAGFETILQEWWNLKNANQVKGMEIRDQYKFGVSCNLSYKSDMTGLPDMEYVHPSRVDVPDSLLPDFSDNPYRFIHKEATALEVFNLFGSQICVQEGKEREAAFSKMLNDKECGYCARNKVNTVAQGNWDTFKIKLVSVEVKTLDWVGVKKNNKKSPYKSFTLKEEECEYKIWSQNTYVFWWLENTDYIFSIERLDDTHRERGEESYQGFRSNIYKSQSTSAVELAIGENRKAQIADIKLQHAVIKSLPPGKFIDLRFLRGALAALKDGNNQYTLQALINLALEQNIMIGDTSGFDKADTQLRPLQEIAGGMRGEIEGYLKIIAQANINIGDYTGINEQLTGQGVNPEGLIGLQKLLINSSLNSLYYVNEAINSQLRKLFSHWAACFKQAIEAGGKTRAKVVSLIGAQKTQLIDELSSIPLHDIGVSIETGQREEERQNFENSLAADRQKGIIGEADTYFLRYIKNPKDQMALLSVMERRWEEKQDKIRQQQFQQQQQLVQQQGQNQVQNTQAATDGKIKIKYAEGDVQAHILQLQAQLGLSADQFESQTKQALQQQRGDAALNKTIQSLQTKNQLENQQAL